MLFGKGWAAGVGAKLADAATMPVMALVSQFAGLLLMSWFVGVTARSEALLTVILGTLAFTILAYASGIFTGKSAYARLVEAGFWLVSLAIMILSQGLLAGG